jgi:hypothetical protein
MDESLPAIAIPLLPGDQDAVVDLQLVFDRCYQTGRYERRVRYAEWSLVPPLSDERLQWVQGRLRERGVLAE